MQPNTPHAVLTLSNSIFEGAHFYSLTTIRDTLASLIDTLIRGLFITNNSHPDLRMLLRKIVHYVHRYVTSEEGEDVDGFHCFDKNNLSREDMMDLLVLVSFGILGNILDPRTYCYRENAEHNEQLSAAEELRKEQYDVNCISDSERVAFVTTRAMALELAEWFTHTYSLVYPSGKETQITCEEVVYSALAAESFGVYMSLKLSTQPEMASPNLLLEGLKRRITALPGPKEFKKRIQTHFSYDIFNTEEIHALYDWDQLGLQPSLIDGIDPWVRGPEDGLFEMGKCDLDRAYFDNLYAGFPV